MVAEIVKNVLRIVIPFEDIYTTVFLVRTDEGVVIFDTATFSSDIDQYVFPVLDELGVDPKYVFISHNHRDHAGGLLRVLERFPKIGVVSRSKALCEKIGGAFVPEDGDLLLKVLRVVAIPGHTQDCMGLLDTRSGTLLTGDSLQLYGIHGSGNWGANIRFPREHIAALEKLRCLDVRTLVASHDYHPCGFIADGEYEVKAYLNECNLALQEIAEMIMQYPALDDASVAKRYNEEKGLPKLDAHVVEAVRRELV